MDKPPEKVLMVDDDRNLLDSFRRQFRKRLNLETATSGADGVQAVRDGGPFALVVSDMQMPNMNGVEFLSKVRELSPNTVRIMLTGNANLDVAIDAVNDGNIFRFLNKPVETEVLYQTAIEGIKQYRLITNEKVLLNKTLKGAVDLLADVLSMVNPDAFSQSSRIKHHVRTIVRSLSLEDGWHYDLAGMLCQLGYVSLPDELIHKVMAGDELSKAETELYNSHPEMGSRLLKHIPRLETVAAMIEHQLDDIGKIEIQGKLNNEQKAILGGQILKVAINYDKLLNTGSSEDKAIEYLRDNPENFDPALVEILIQGSMNRKVEILNLPLDQLEPGMIVDQPIKTNAGALLLAKGQPLSQAMVFKLKVAYDREVLPETSFRVFRITPSD
ncbi:MAG: response regulator [Candidatus Thiodiazotropha taylori]|nr:response regulator [Candidatus Thiodiazotropha taylori]RLW53393.1 MAG: histidine kinase [gamma proteobacterium symbiont of Stewartia floridana]MCG7925510.1 response regulator [Candidatus Thiodiazotropha taylori]MCG7933762.1 response regulator [Candidatus Thiodiazotropha taylori]MCG7970033.1 response regulator [Candidatus Thiodiazotropha taylori]